ncbi:hypothetical protein [Longispora albida]|uniref:hypothetical protein n=1 Tax=Longispora albida TaxID=203523 RepID=UPI000372F941|nr:hypothetical protein [Longispora albida]
MVLYRLAGTVSCVGAGALLAALCAAGTRGGVHALLTLAGAFLGYAFAHTLGWLTDRLTGHTRTAGTPHQAANRYTMRTTTLSGALSTGIALGLIAMIVVPSLLAKNKLFGLAAALLAVVAVLWLRRAVLSDVEVTVGAETLVIRARNRRRARLVRDDHPWEELRLPLHAIVRVDRFADPFGLGRWLLVDAGERGRFELRATGVLSGRRASAAIGRLGSDLLDRLGATRGTRPYLTRWGTWRYVRNNR